MFVFLLDELILGFCYGDLTLETGGFELASTITLVLQAKRLTKCASHPEYLNALYLMIGEVIGHIECSTTDKNNENKDLVFDSTDENKKVFKK